MLTIPMVTASCPSDLLRPPEYADAKADLDSMNHRACHSPSTNDSDPQRSARRIPFHSIRKTTDGPHSMFDRLSCEERVLLSEIQGESMV